MSTRIRAISLTAVLVTMIGGCILPGVPRHETRPPVTVEYLGQSSTNSLLAVFRVRNVSNKSTFFLEEDPKKPILGRQWNYEGEWRYDYSRRSNYYSEQFHEFKPGTTFTITMLPPLVNETTDNITKVTEWRAYWVVYYPGVWAPKNMPLAYVSKQDGREYSQGETVWSKPIAFDPVAVKRSQQQK